MKTNHFTLNKMSEDEQNSESSGDDLLNLSQFITPHIDHNEEPVKKQEEDIKQEPKIETTKEIPPRAGQKYWLSSEAKKQKNEYMRGYYLRKKAALEQIKAHQIRPRDLKLLNVNDKLVVRHLEYDSDYVRIIGDLLGTLMDNHLLKDFDLSEIH